MSEGWKEQLKTVIPKPIWLRVSLIWYAYQRVLQIPSATFHPSRRESIHRLGQYHDIHKGKRCFIVGNGPSLKKTDLTKLTHEYTFGLNRIYLLFPEIGFMTTYLVVVNNLVIEQFFDKMLEFPIPKFFAWHAHTLVNHPPDMSSEHKPIYLHTTYSGPKFSKDARHRLWEGATVTYVALQLAYYMGFEKVVLIGIDHNFSTTGRPNTTITSQGDDPNHFSSTYFGKGIRWQLPDLVTSERAYGLARRAYEQDGRQVLDATIDGNLSVFPKVNYLDMF